MKWWQGINTCRSSHCSLVLFVWQIANIQNSQNLPNSFWDLSVDGKSKGHTCNRKKTSPIKKHLNSEKWSNKNFSTFFESLKYISPAFWCFFERAWVRRSVRWARNSFLQYLQNALCLLSGTGANQPTKTLNSIN